MRPVHDLARAALAGVARSDAARPLDLALGRWLAGRAAEAGADGEAQASLALAGALLAWAERDGHSRVPMAAWAGLPFPGETTDGAPLPPLPRVDRWRAALDASGLAGTLDDGRPLVAEATAAGPTLALYRLAAAERRVAVRLAALATPDPLAGPDALAEAFAATFPLRDAIDAQALAVAAALHGRLTAIAGGPGTGKTYTVARLLALARAARPGLRVALAAPTGKAAQRLADSIQAQLPDGEAAPATPATTLHRLLGVRPGGGWRHGEAAPLAADLVLVDEASMVSLPLMDALVAALAPGARLVLLGDPDQLASVEAGAVFGDLCAAGAGEGGTELARFAGSLGLPGVPSRGGAPPLASCVVTLTESRRFTSGSGIGAVARAVRDGDAAASREALAHGDDVRLVGGDAAAEAVAWAAPFARAVAEAPTPAEALAALDRFRLLAATRRGPTGTAGLNAAVEAALGGTVGRARPRIVTVNDYGVGLFNGDVGVAWTDDAGERVFVVSDGAAQRRIPLVRVPPSEPAWALTVHKSQGSEADAVGLVLPPVGSAAAGRLTRELLYTAVTRARREAVVFGEAAVWDAGVRARTVRASGLAEAWRAAEARQPSAP